VQHDGLEAHPHEAHDVAEGKDVGKVSVDGGSGADGDPWRGVDDSVAVRAGVVDRAYDGDAMDGGVEGAERDELVEEGLGVVGDGRVLTEGDKDDVGTIVDGRVENYEDVSSGTLRRSPNLVGGDVRSRRVALDGASG
jgi:hypothetical protein